MNATGNQFPHILLVWYHMQKHSVLVIWIIHFWVNFGGEELLGLAELNRMLANCCWTVQRQCFVCHLNKVSRFYRYSKIATIYSRIVFIYSRVGTRHAAHICRESLMDCCWIWFGWTLKEIRFKRTPDIPRNRLRRRTIENNSNCAYFIVDCLKEDSSWRKGCAACAMSVEDG